MAIRLFFLGHWFISGFMQTFFLHRYASHSMFRMSKTWERVMYVLTWFTQGSSFLNPRAYAILHRMHHAYSDTEQDPHSPVHSKNIMDMMVKTYNKYSMVLNRKTDEGIEFETNIPEWTGFDRTFGGLWARAAFMFLYVLFYLRFAKSPLAFLLLPVHFFMGPVHGAIVNWFGHKVGYRNYKDSGDDSRNTLVFDFLAQGELFQNNHHMQPDNPNLGHKWFEIDPAYPLLKLLAYTGIIRFRREAI